MSRKLIAETTRQLPTVVACLLSFVVLGLSSDGNAVLRPCVEGLAELVAPTPAPFFTNKTLRGTGGIDKPRFVMLVGLPGSGKSHWVDAARKQNWSVISLDEIRIALVLRMKSRKEKIRLQGRSEEPDPAKSEHVFSINAQAFQLANEMLDRALIRRQSVVFDATNIDPRRSAQIDQARKAGYHTGAIVFETADVGVNSRNIRQRVEKGGLDLANVNSQDPDRSRALFLAHLKARMDSYPLAERSGSGMHKDDSVDQLYFVGVRDWSQEARVMQAENQLLSQIEGQPIDPVVIPHRTRGVTVQVPGLGKGVFATGLNGVREASKIPALRKDSAPSVVLMTDKELLELRKLLGSNTPYVLRRIATETGLKDITLKGLVVLPNQDGVLLDPRQFRRFREEIAKIFQETRNEGEAPSYHFNVYPFRFELR